MIDTARNTYIAAKKEFYVQVVERSHAITAARTGISRDLYYRELARERSFGGAEFTPTC